MWIFTVVLVGLQVVSAVVCRGAEHSAKWVVVRYLSYIAKFVYNGAVVAIVKPVFHNFELIFYGGKCTKLFLIAVFFARILKNKSGKKKEFDSSFSAQLIILQGYALGILQMALDILKLPMLFFSVYFEKSSIFHTIAQQSRIHIPNNFRKAYIWEKSCLPKFVKFRIFFIQHDTIVIDAIIHFVFS